MHRALFAVVIVASVFVGLTPPHLTAASSDPCISGTPCYYLALGDSLAYGYQPNLNLTHGYAADIETALSQKYPGITLENLGCVGETTSTMLGLNGTTCPYWQYTTGMTQTPQITQTVDFLQNHPGQVHLITLDIGANDALQILQTNPTSDTLTTFLNQYSAHLDQILTEIQSAANASGNQQAPIMVMNNYNPLVASSSSTFLVLAGQVFNNTLSTVVAQHSGVSVVDVYSTFNPTPATNPAIMICQLTWYCSKQYRGDPHANSLGYKVIAALFWQAGVKNV